MASYLTLPFRTAPLEGSLIPSLEVHLSLQLLHSVTHLLGINSNWQGSSSCSAHSTPSTMVGPAHTPLHLLPAMPACSGA